MWHFRLCVVQNIRQNKIQKSKFIKWNVLFIIMEFYETVTKGSVIFVYTVYAVVLYSYWYLPFSRTMWHVLYIEISFNKITKLKIKHMYNLYKNNLNIKQKINYEKRRSPNYTIQMNMCNWRQLKKKTSYLCWTEYSNT